MATGKSIHKAWHEFRGNLNMVAKLDKGKGGIKLVPKGLSSRLNERQVSRFQALIDLKRRE